MTRFVSDPFGFKRRRLSPEAKAQREAEEQANREYVARQFAAVFGRRSFRDALAAKETEK